MQYLRSAFLTIALSSAAFAQSTWVVDAANGGGSQFTDIQSAIQAANHGDLILVRAGLYNGPVLCSKGVRLVAAPGVRLVNGTTSGVTLQVSGVPAGKNFSMTGFEVLHGTYNNFPGLFLTSNAGTLSFKNVRFYGLWRGMDIQSCASVSMTGCTIQAQLRCSLSHVTLTSSRVQGGVDPFRAYTNICELDQTTLVLAKTFITVYTLGSYSYVGRAVFAKASNIRLHAGADLTSVGPGDIDVLVGNGSSTLVADPSAQFQPSGNGKPYVGFQVATRSLPTLDVLAQGVGAPIALELVSPGNWLWVLQVGLSGGPLTVAPFGDLGIDLSTLLIIGAGVSNGSPVKLQIPTPNLPALRGVPFAYQTASGPWPTLEYSNVVATMLD
ncbi:MAG: hypothetical protein KDC95_01090 [Planctomycetes bacterium]|nr:hypothetical protein [Planctomycetota bacterium]